jgi:hypothetical protein
MRATIRMHRLRRAGVFLADQPPATGTVGQPRTALMPENEHFAQLSPPTPHGCGRTGREAEHDPSANPVRCRPWSRVGRHLRAGVQRLDRCSGTYQQSRPRAPE